MLKMNVFGVCLSITLTAMCGNGVGFENSDFPGYSDVVGSLQLWFHASCVYIVHPEVSLAVDRSLVGQARSRHYSEKSTLLHWKLGILDETLHRLRCRGNRPLFALFSDATSRHYLRLLGKIPSHPRWVLFLDGATTAGAFLQDVDIPFDCEFLVAAYHDNFSRVELTEVFRLARGNPLTATPYGHWSRAGRLAAITDSLYARRNSLMGITIKASAIHSDPSLLMTTGSDGTVTVGGYLGNVWNILEKRMNFTTEFIRPEGNRYGAQFPNGSWDGVIKMIVRNEVMFGVSEFTMINSRLQAVDYLMPLFVSSMRLYIQEPATLSSDWPSFLAPFAGSLWFGILLTILLVSVTLTVVHHVARRHAAGDDDVDVDGASLFRLGDSVLHVFALFCQQGNEMTPRYSCRAMCFLAGFTSTVVLAAYSAALTSYLTTQRAQLPFDTLQGFCDDGSYRLEAVGSTAGTDLLNTSSDPLLNKLLDLILLNVDTLPENAQVGLDRLCQVKKYAFCASHSVADVYATGLPCAIVPIGKSLGIEVLTIITTKNNPYKGLANHALHLLRDSGALLRLRRLTWPERVTTTDKQLPDVTLKQVTLIFAVIFVGNVGAAIVLACERIRHHYVQD